MHLGPILRALMRNKTGMSLLVLQIALTLAVLMNAASLMVRGHELATQQTGVDLANVIILRHEGIGAAYDSSSYRKGRLREDLAVIRALPGVVAASVSDGVPSANGSFTTVMVPDSEVEANVSQFTGDAHFFDTIGVAIVEGRNFLETEVPFASSAIKAPGANAVILTRPAADRLYPDGSAVGKTLGAGDWLKTIVGIAAPFEASPPLFGAFGISPDVAAVFPAQLDRKTLTFLVRVEPGRAAELLTTIEERLRELDPERDLRDGATLEEVRAEITGLFDYAHIVLGVISGLLVLTTGLGIFGLASFSVAKRRKQIGTRRALGARRPDIVRQFVVENLVITSAGVALGLLLGLALNVVLTAVGLARIQPGLIVACVVFVVLLGVAAVLVPALAASRVSPAVATRTV